MTPTLTNLATSVVLMAHVHTQYIDGGNTRYYGVSCVMDNPGTPISFFRLMG